MTDFEQALREAADEAIDYCLDHTALNVVDVEEILKRHLAPMQERMAAMESLFIHVIEILNDSNESMTTARQKIKREYDALHAKPKCETCVITGCTSPAIDDSIYCRDHDDEYAYGDARARIVEVERELRTATEEKAAWCQKAHDALAQAEKAERWNTNDEAFARQAVEALSPVREDSDTTGQMNTQGCIQWLVSKVVAGHKRISDLEAELAARPPMPEVGKPEYGEPWSHEQDMGWFAMKETPTKTGDEHRVHIERCVNALAGYTDASIAALEAWTEGRRG